MRNSGLPKGPRPPAWGRIPAEQPAVHIQEMGCRRKSAMKPWRPFPIYNRSRAPCCCVRKSVPSALAPIGRMLRAGLANATQLENSGATPSTAPLQLQKRRTPVRHEISANVRRVLVDLLQLQQLLTQRSSTAFASQVRPRFPTIDAVKEPTV